MNESLAFRSLDERHDTERRALAGDVEAAMRLAACSFYLDEDLASAKRWYAVAANSGSKTAKENLESLNRIDSNEWAAAHRKK
jgi:TPR repeat protein